LSYDGSAPWNRQYWRHLVATHHQLIAALDLEPSIVATDSRAVLLTINYLREAREPLYQAGSKALPRRTSARGHLEPWMIILLIRDYTLLIPSLGAYHVPRCLSNCVHDDVLLLYHGDFSVRS
jgi:hypothetical protein